MKIMGNQLKLNDFMGNNKKDIGFKPWNSKTIMSGQNIFGFNNIKQKKNENVEGGGNIGSVMNKKIIDDIVEDRIAKKIARGESLTGEERDKLTEIDPEKLEKAKRANERRKELESRLKRAKNKKEARDIILQAKMEANIVLDKVDEKYGEYLVEAVNKAEVNYKNKDIKDIKDNTKDLLHEEKGKFFDIKM
ncbi:hypothetical protein [Tissierella praeacuta]|uniref:hypothetical protein n=1 Tax=Tissierella praeacuta TaxID=43131 RepID=UPI00334129E0